MRPLAEVPGKVADKAAEKMADGIAKGTNWTVVFSVIAPALAGIIALRWRLYRSPAQDTKGDK